MKIFVYYQKETSTLLIVKSINKYQAINQIKGYLNTDDPTTRFFVKEVDIDTIPEDTIKKYGI